MSVFLDVLMSLTSWRLLTTTDVIVRLLNAFAEEQATEDAVYYMGEALRKGVVELDVFLKVIARHVDVS